MKETKILLTASFLALFPMGLFLPIYAIFVKNIGGDILDAGVAYGLFSITSGLFILFITRTKLFKTHLRWMVLIGYSLLTLASAGYFLVQTPTDLFLIQILLGIAGGLLDPSWDGLFSGNRTELQSTQQWSIWNGGKNIIIGIGALIGASLVTAYSFTLLFTVMFLCNFLATLVSLQLVLRTKTRL